MSRRLFLALAMLLFAMDRTTIAEENRTVHQPDLAALTRRVLTGTYTVDPRFVDFISHPSAVYTDLYGIHALQDFTRQQILDDFVPRYATLLRDGDHTFDLQFSKGWNATFYPNAILDIKAINVSRDHVYIGGSDAPELIENLKDFHRMLNESNTQTKYLVPNPFYHVEKVTNELYYSGKPTVPVTFDPDMQGFRSATNAVLIYPDGVHGNLPYFNTFMERLGLADIQWLGLEMLSSSMQSTLDHFCTAPVDTSDYVNARLNLINYFLSAWTPYFQLNITSGDQSPYFQAVDLVRQKKGRVYGLDIDSTEFLIFRYGESDFGASVRSRNWALSVPTTGRGMMFGGSAHFMMNRSSNVQDFLHERDANLQLFSIRTLTPPEPTNHATGLGCCLFLILCCLINTYSFSF